MLLQWFHDQSQSVHVEHLDALPLVYRALGAGEPRLAVDVDGAAARKVSGCFADVPNHLFATADDELTDA